MKHIKDITISIFAIIGFAFVLSSFTSNETSETQEVVYGTPESHVWELTENGKINKVTGEVKMFYTLRNGKSDPIGVKSYTPKEIGYGDYGK